MSDVVPGRSPHAPTPVASAPAVPAPSVPGRATPPRAATPAAAGAVVAPRAGRPALVAALPAIAAVYWVGYLLLRTVGPARQADPGLAADLASVLPNVATTLAALVTAHRLRADRPERLRERRGWQLFAVAYALLLAANLCWLASDVDGTVAGALSLDRLGQWTILLSYVPLVGGLLALPAPRLTPRDRIRVGLDWCIVVLGAWMLLWDGLVHRGVGAQPLRLLAVVERYGPTGADFAVLVTIVGLLLAGALPRLRPTLRLLALGRGAAVVAGLVTMRAPEAFAGRDALAFVVADAFWILAAGLDLLALARWRPSTAAVDDDERPAAAEDARTRELAGAASLIPYAFLLAGFAVLLGNADAIWASPLGAPLAAATGLTAMVVVRQLLALADNRRLVRERAAQEARFRSLVQHASDVVTVVDAEGAVWFVSPALKRVLGHDLPDTPMPNLAPVSRDFTRLVHPDDRAAARHFLATVVAGGPEHVTAAVSWRVRHARGDWRHVETTATNLLADPAVRGVVLNSRDVTDQRRLEDELTHRALHDPLTGLANRSLLRDRAEHALALAARHPDGARRVAMLLVDLDDFKHVNDSLGHGAGDALLVTVSRRLLAATRTSDTVARLGGDEFAVLLEEMADPADATMVAERIVRAMGAPVPLEAKEVVIGASVGIAVAQEGDGVEELVRNADVALYEAKGRGKRGHATYAPAMHAAALARLELEADLRAALDAVAAESGHRTVRHADEASAAAHERALDAARLAALDALDAAAAALDGVALDGVALDEPAELRDLPTLELPAPARDLRRTHRMARRGGFHLVYQPIVSLDGGQVVGAEALLRWRRPNGDVVPPDVFIPVAEESGLIVPLGRWALREACRQLAEWDRTWTPLHGKPLRLSVNLSPRQLLDPQLCQDVAEALADHGVGPERLLLELTETAMMQDPERAGARLRELKALGLRLALDDFGTGYSSLGHLRRFPVDVLKIDRAFVRELAPGADFGRGDAALVRAVVRMADALGLRTVAEGIEHPAQVDTLRALGCALGQGFAYAAPLAPSGFAALLDEQLAHGALKPV